MTTRDEEYQLGRDVTHLAKADGKRGTAVISVRLGAAYIARLEVSAGKAEKPFPRSCGTPLPPTV